ncbi:MAG TPA: hypothetical protein VGP70_14045 [Actinomadura sp.]|jgi:hypothetical protein|nr:hypothetical protein [Actinomadura sp.]
MVGRPGPVGQFEVGEGFEFFWQVIIDSPALQARAREWVEELENVLGDLFAEADGADPRDPWPRLTAALAITAYRTAYVTSAKRILAGEGPDDVIDDHIALLSRSFAALEEALDPRVNAPRTNEGAPRSSSGR